MTTTERTSDAETLNQNQINRLWREAKSRGFTTDGIYELLHDFGGYNEADEVPTEKFEDLLGIVRQDGMAEVFNSCTYDGLR